MQFTLRVYVRVGRLMNHILKLGLKMSKISLTVTDEHLHLWGVFLFVCLFVVVVVFNTVHTYEEPLVCAHNCSIIKKPCCKLCKCKRALL